jgi:hypothetical protein
MSKDRKVRNFDFLKQTPTELPSREEVIQKTAELTGQKRVGEEVSREGGTGSSVSEPIFVVPEPPVVKIVEPIFPTIPTPVKVAEIVAPVTIEKEKKAPIKKPKAVEPPPVVQAIVEKGKVGRRALVDTRKPFTTTITVDNKRQLRQLCAEYDIAMSDVINEILSAHFEQRTPSF